MNSEPTSRIRIDYVEKQQDQILGAISQLRSEAKEDSQELWTTINGQVVSLEKLKSSLSAVQATLLLGISSGAILYLVEKFTN